MLYPEINDKKASSKRSTLHSSHWTLDIEPCVFCSMRFPHPMNSRTATVSHSYHWIPNHHRISQVRCGERLATAKVWTSSLAMMQFHKENGFFWNAHEWMINAFLGSFFGCSSRPRQTVRLAYAFLRETRKKLSGYFRKPKTIEPWKCKSGPWKIAAFCCREWVEVFLVKEDIFLNLWNLSINTCVFFPLRLFAIVVIVVPVVILLPIIITITLMIIMVITVMMVIIVTVVVICHPKEEWWEEFAAFHREARRCVLTSITFRQAHGSKHRMILRDAACQVVEGCAPHPLARTIDYC